MPLPLVDQQFIYPKAWPIVTFLSFLQDRRNRLLVESIGRTLAGKSCWKRLSVLAPLYSLGNKKAAKEPPC
jgi:hypothetical protein